MKTPRRKSPAPPLPPVDKKADNRERRRIPDFAYSVRNKSSGAYLNRAKVLRDKYGVEFGFPLNKKLSPQQKSSVTRKTRRLAHYLKPEHNFIFAESSAKKLRAVKRRGDIEREAITSKGVFIQAPKRVFLPKGYKKLNTKVEISGDGEIKVKTGKRVSSRKIYKSGDIIADPARVLRDAKKRGATHVLVNIRGFAGNQLYTVGQFYYYLSKELLPDIEEAQDDEESESAFRKNIGVEFVSFRNNEPKQNRNRSSIKRGKV